MLDASSSLNTQSISYVLSEVELRCLNCEGAFPTPPAGD